MQEVISILIYLLTFEYEVGVDNQLYYAETRESEPTSSSTFNNTWNGLYSTLKSARIIINQCSEGGIDHGNYVTKVWLKCWLLIIAH